MDKHYTPENIEFHKDFVFEYKPRQRDGIMSYVRGEFRYVDTWEKQIFRIGVVGTMALEISEYTHPPSGFDSLETYLKDDAIRVKCLDRSDIEGEGWESTSGVGYRKLFTAEQYRKSTIYMADDEYLYLSTSPTEKENVINIHNGGSHEQADGVRVEIKNLSEFRRILKQIGV